MKYGINSPTLPSALSNQLAKQRSLGWLPLLAIFAALGGCGGGSSGGSDGGGGNTTKLEPTSYTVYKTGQEAALSGAGAVSGSQLSLGAGGSTTLTVTDENTFAMTATNTNYQVVNRRKGAVLMLCDPLPAGGKPGDTHAQYVAIATNSATAETQAVPVTNASELAGKSFYEMDECSYVKEDGVYTSEKQNSAPSGATLEFRFDANGNGRSPLGPVDAATVTSWLNGTPFIEGKGRKVWFSAYKFIVDDAQKIYFAIRVEPQGEDQGFVVLWTDDPNSDVIGCSLNCAKPADAVPVTNPATVPGVYVTQFGFGQEISVVWADAAGNYSFGYAPSIDNSVFNKGLELGTLSFDSSGAASAVKTYDTNGPGEAIRWSANATQVVSTAIADPSRHFIQERIAKDPANLIVGAWALESCNGAPAGSTSLDPRSRILFVYLKSGHYVMLDSLGGDVGVAPPGIEYGTYTFDSATGKQRITGNLQDTNNDAGLWDPVAGQPGIAEFTLSFTDNGDTMNFNSTAADCSTGIMRRVN